MQVGRDDAELGSQLEHIPIVVAEHADGRDAVGREERAVLVREQFQQDGLARAIGTDDGRVLADADRQRQTIENAAIVLDDAGRGELEDRLAHCKYKVQSAKYKVSGKYPPPSRVSRIAL